MQHSVESSTEPDRADNQQPANSRFGWDWIPSVIAYLCGMLAISAVLFLGSNFVSVSSWMTSSTVSLITAHDQLKALHQELQLSVKQAPTGNHQVTDVKKLKERTKIIKQSIRTSKHPAKPSLMTAIAKMEIAARQKSTTEATAKLADAEKKLKEAAKKLGL